MNLLEKALEAAYGRTEKEGLLKDHVSIRARVLSPEEAIGNPEEYDFPLLKGKERIVEADFRKNPGHAFTDTYGGFEGTLKEVLSAGLTNNYRRALCVAAVNALVKYWGLVDNTAHCKDTQPKICASKISDHIKKAYPRVKRICFIGYQPAMIDALSKAFTLEVLDLDRDNIGKEKFGSIILDGNKDTESAIEHSELILATGSTLVNGTIDGILAMAEPKDVIFYGVTIAGAAALLGLKRICFT